MTILEGMPKGSTRNSSEIPQSGEFVRVIWIGTDGAEEEANFVKTLPSQTEKLLELLERLVKTTTR